MIALLLQSDQKGLPADDYDGSKWSDRLDKLKPATRQPSLQFARCGISPTSISAR